MDGGVDEDEEGEEGYYDSDYDYGLWMIVDDDGR